MSPPTRQTPVPDWLAAFAAHPQIGDRTREGGHSSAEQRASAASQTPETAEALRQGNRRYLSRFGFVFIVCAQGREAGEIARELQRRYALGGGASRLSASWG